MAYLELFGKRIYGWKATVLAIVLLPPAIFLYVILLLVRKP